MPAATMCLEDDHVLVGRFQEGEITMFDELYSRHVERVYNLAYRLTGDEETARDVCQDAFIRVYQHLGRFRFDAKFTTWLHTIVLNLARSHYRKTKKESRIDIEPETLGGETEDPANKLALSESKETVRRHLKSLPDREREALVLRHYEGFSCKEAAELMGCAEETVRTLSFFGIRKIRDALRREGYEL